MCKCAWSTPQRCFPRTACAPRVLQALVGTSWGFLTNVERAIIMPSLWLYLQTQWSKEAAEKFYAAILAAFCLAVLLFTPLVGFASYKGVRTNVLLIASSILEIIGNIMYLVGYSPWILLVGRFVSGAGACCDPPLYSDMVKLTTQKQRTSYVIAMLLPRQVGLLFGPIFNLIVHKMNLNMGSFKVNVYNAPGMIMAALWIVQCFLIFMVYPDVDAEVDEKPSDDEYLSFGYRFRHYIIAKRTKKEVASTSAKQESLSGTDNSPTKGEIPPGHSLFERTCRACKPYISFKMITMYGIVFMVYYTTFGLEAVLPPVANRLFGWSEVAVSIVYLACGGAIILLFVLYECLTWCVQDRSMLTVGVIHMMFSCIWLTNYLAYNSPLPTPTSIALMMTGISFHVVGTPMVAISCESLYTKIAPIDDMERAQTVFRTVLNIGYFVGPFVSGSLVATPWAAFLIMMLLVFMPTVCLFLEYESFREPNYK